MYSSTNSLPNTTMFCEKVTELKLKIEQMTLELDGAHTEIQSLLSENYTLKKELDERKKINETLQCFLKSSTSNITPKSKNTSVKKKKQRKIKKKNQNQLNLSTNDLSTSSDQEAETYQNKTHNQKQNIVSENKDPNSDQVTETINNKSQIPETYKVLENKDEDNNRNYIQPVKIIEKRNKIVFCGDENAKNIGILYKNLVMINMMYYA